MKNTKIYSMFQEELIQAKKIKFFCKKYNISKNMILMIFYSNMYIVNKTFRVPFIHKNILTVSSIHPVNIIVQ